MSFRRSAFGFGADSRLSSIVYTSSEYSGLEIGMRSTYYSSTQGVRGVTPGTALTVQNDESASMSCESSESLSDASRKPELTTPQSVTIATSPRNPSTT